MGYVEYDHFVQKNNKRWFWSRSGGGLYCQDTLSGEMELIYTRCDNHIIDNSDCSFGVIFLLDDQLVLAPRYVQELLIYNLGQKQASKLFLPDKSNKGGEYFLDAFQTVDEIILVPRRYHAFVHLDKRSLQIRAGKSWYDAYGNKGQKPGEESDFVAKPVVNNKNVYLAFYNTPKVLKYDICSMEYAIYDTRKIGDKIEIYENDEISLLIIERLDCIRIETDDKGIVDVINEFIKENHCNKIIKYEDNIFFFTETSIYALKKGEHRIKTVDWYAQIEENYLKRVYYKGLGRSRDSLVVFQERNVLYISFALEKYRGKCFVKIDKQDVTVEYEKVYERNEVEILLQHMQDFVQTRQTGIKDSIGLRIYRGLNEKYGEK